MMEVYPERNSELQTKVMMTSAKKETREKKNGAIVSQAKSMS
jgi:hypothetical protein